MQRAPPAGTLWAIQLRLSFLQPPSSCLPGGCSGLQRLPPRLQLQLPCRKLGSPPLKQCCKRMRLLCCILGPAARVVQCHLLAPGCCLAGECSAQLVLHALAPALGAQRRKRCENEALIPQQAMAVQLEGHAGHSADTQARSHQTAHLLCMSTSRACKLISRRVSPQNTDTS